VLSRTGHSAEAPIILRKAAAVQSERDLAEVERVAEQLGARGASKRKPPARLVTFRELGEQWTSGELHRKWPDYVKLKRSASMDQSRLEALYEAIGSVPLASFTLDDAERAMQAVDPGLSSATRRQYAQVVSKVLRLAVYPCKLIERSPLPVGFLPTVRSSRVTAYVYPDEDAALLGWSEDRARAERKHRERPGVPLMFRVLYGFLAREGLRLSEALGLRWKDVDLERGVVTLDTN
jgi:integrase